MTPASHSIEAYGRSCHGMWGTRMWIRKIFKCSVAVITSGLIGQSVEAQPNATVIPDELEFGATEVNSSKLRSFAVSNQGADTAFVTLSSSNVDFTIDSGPDTLAPGATDEVVVRFLPTSAGAAVATITVQTSSFLDSDPTVTANGNGVTPREIGTDTLLVDFGVLTVGESTSKSVMIRNLGTSTQVPLQIPSVRMLGAVGHFNYTRPPGFSLTGGASRAIVIEFAPQAPGTHILTVEVNHTSIAGDFAPGGSPTAMRITLQGEALALPQLGANSPSDATLAFGDVRLGQTSNAQSGSVLSGSSTTIFEEIWVTSEDFSVTVTDSSLLGTKRQTGEEFLFQVTFSPKKRGTRSAQLLVRSNDPDENVRSWDLNGTGVAPQLAVPSPGELDFGVVSVSELSSTQSLQITNQSSAVGTDLGVIVELSTEHYAVDKESLTVAPGQSGVVEVSFGPLTPGTKSATLVLRTTNDPDGSTFEVPLMGLGVSPNIEISLADADHTLRFGSVRRIEGVLTEQFVIRNAGSETATITRSEVRPEVFTASIEAVSISPGDSILVGVTFAPESVGLHEGTLILEGDLGAPGDVDSLIVSLSGYGSSPRLVVHPSALEFQTVTIPNRDTLHVLVQNSGDEDLEIEWDSSSSSGSFEVAGGRATLPPDATTEIEVVFRPTLPRHTTSFLEIRTNDPAARTRRVVLDGNSVQTDLALNDLDFGDVLIGGVPGDGVVTVRNLGSTSVDVTVEELAGTFSVASRQLTIGADAIEQIRIQFTPEARRTFSGKLSIRGQNGEVFSASLNGVGVEPEISLPSSEQFQSAVRRSERDTLAVTVRNAGTAILHIDGIRIEKLSGGVGSFERLTNPPLDLSPGEIAEIGIEFQPSDVGVFEAILIVESDDSSTPIDTVGISGTGKGPFLEVTSVDGFDFGGVRHSGVASAGGAGRKVIRVANSGTDTLFVRGVATADLAQFSVEDIDEDIPPGGEVLVNATFQPTGPGDHRTSIVVEIDRPQENVRWTDELVGVGIRPEINASLSTLIFDPAQVNLGVDTRTLTLTNTGTDVLRISDIVVEDDGNFDTLSLSSRLPVDLAPRDESGDRLVVELRFAPKHRNLAAVTATTLSYQTRLLVVSDDVDRTTIAIDLTGTGSVSSIAPDDSVLAFGRVRVGDTGAETLRIRNEGGDAVLQASFSDPQFAIQGDTLFSVSSPYKDVHITFSPASRNGNQAIVSMLTLVDATTSRSYEVALSGEGIRGALDVTEQSLDFGPSRVAVPMQDEVTLTNVGNDSMTVILDMRSVENQSPQAAAQFTSFDTVYLEMGETKRVPIAFTALVVGRSAALLAVTPVDRTIPTEGRVSLAGTGIAPLLRVQDVDFEEIAFGETQASQLQVQNQGSDSLTIKGIFVESAYRRLFEISRSSQFSVPPNTTSPVDLRLAANDTSLIGVESVDLHVIHESSDHPNLIDTSSVRLFLAVVDMASPEISFTSNFQSFTPLSSQLAGASMPFEVFIRDNSGQIRSEETSVWWRRGGDDRFAPLNLELREANNGAWRGTSVLEIPQDEASRGIEYVLRTVDGSGNSVVLDAGGLQTGLEVSASAPFAVSILIDGLEGAQVEEKPRVYHMVSVPMVPDAADVFDVVRRALGRSDPITGRDQKKWRIYKGTSAAGLQELKPGRTSERFLPGKAFWLVLNDRPINMSVGRGWSTTTIPSFDTTLTETGWHLIGHPYNFPVSWSDVEADGQPLASGRGSGVRFWEYGSEFGAGAGAWGIHPAGMRPWRGYAVHVTKRTTLEIHPHVLRATGKQVPPPVHRADWRARLIASSSGAVDVANVFGMAASASDDWGDEDDIEPPPVGECVRAFFVPITGSPSPVEQMSCDVRQTAEGATWSLSVESNLKSGPATLEVQSERVPLDMNLELVDLESGVRQNMREKSRYTYRNSRVHRFLLIAGSTSYVDEILAGLMPSHSDLRNGFPNPFNAEISINYGLSVPGSVKLEIFNIAGQHVKTLIDESVAAGYYKTVWNGTNTTGNTVGSGTYFVRMRTAASSKVLKILLLR